jgi:hypothetical protein
MNLKSFIQRNKEEFGAELRCGSCGNSLPQCGKYTIEQVNIKTSKKQATTEEGILCETCNKNGRKISRITRIIESPQTNIKQISNVAIRNIDTKQLDEQEAKFEEFKKIEAESVANLQTKSVDENAKSIEKAKEEEDKKKDD